MGVLNNKKEKETPMAKRPFSVLVVSESEILFAVISITLHKLAYCEVSWAMDTGEASDWLGKYHADVVLYEADLSVFDVTNFPDNIRNQHQLCSTSFVFMSFKKKMNFEADLTLFQPLHNGILVSTIVHIKNMSPGEFI